tara:strand:- start:4901 stop:5305 length:405 start_codon:yes stop_codon:yes gene_type:complete
MKLSLYKIIHNNGEVFYTNDRRELINNINDANKNDADFHKVNINTINGLLYNKSKQTRGFKEIHRYDAQEYFKDYLDVYVDGLMKKKDYAPQTILRFKNHFTSFINAIELEGRNSGQNDQQIRERINAVGLVKV